MFIMVKDKTDSIVVLNFDEIIKIKLKVSLECDYLISIGATYFTNKEEYRSCTIICYDIKKESTLHGIFDVYLDEFVNGVFTLMLNELKNKKITSLDLEGTLLSYLDDEDVAKQVVAMLSLEL